AVWSGSRVPECGGRLRLFATIEDPAVVRRIFSHLGIPTGCPQPLPARLPSWCPTLRVLRRQEYPSLHPLHPEPVDERLVRAVRSGVPLERWVCTFRANS